MRRRRHPRRIRSFTTATIIGLVSLSIRTCPSFFTHWPRSRLAHYRAFLTAVPVISVEVEVVANIIAKGGFHSPPWAMRPRGPECDASPSPLSRRSASERQGKFSEPTSPPAPEFAHRSVPTLPQSPDFPIAGLFRAAKTRPLSFPVTPLPDSYAFMRLSTAKVEQNVEHG